MITQQHEQHQESDRKDEATKPGGHTTTIIINARLFEVDAKELSFEDVVNLNFNNAPPRGENWVITVTYSRGEHGQSGTMLPDDRVKVKNKMVFDVSATDRS